MKMITSITFSLLHNDEFKGLHSEGVNLAKAITDKDVQKAVAEYESSVNALSEFLKASFTDSMEKKAHDLDIERNDIYVASRKVAMAATKIPDASVAEIGEQISKLFDSTPSPIKANQAESTGIFDSIIQGLKVFDEEKLAACGFKEWAERLETANRQFMEADLARFSKRCQKEIENCKILRAACIKAYNILVGAAFFKAAEGSESCSNFLECMDKLVIAKKVQLKMRQKPKKKEKAENAATTEATETAANNEAANNAAPTTDNDSTVGVENAA
ncbi:MAG: DUF6261 family protein [Fibrobacter sp.]|nr:DUF6261 family protein [Fibrobacter sp.]